jgi:hypothetical protein
VYGAVVHSWEFCDESDRQLVFTEMTRDNSSWATVISTTNALQPAATAVFCIMFVFHHRFWYHSQINDKSVSFENFTNFVQKMVFWVIAL